jgi:hypothetical protein
MVEFTVVVLPPRQDEPVIEPLLVVVVDEDELLELLEDELDELEELLDDELLEPPVVVGA